MSNLSFARADSLPLLSSHLSAREYLQDGLVAMWDGIENAGYEVHDSNATTWKDLAGTRDATLGPAGRFGTDHLECLGGVAATFDSYDVADAYFNINLVLSDINNTTNSSWGCIVAFSRGAYNKKFAWIANETKNLNLGWSNVSSAQTAMPLMDGVHAYSANLKKDSSNTALITEAYIDNIQQQTSHYYRGSWPFGGKMGFDGTSSSAPDNPTRYITGKIYRVSLYSRALTTDEIAHNYAVDKARFRLN